MSSNNPFAKLVNTRQSGGAHLAVLDPSDDPAAPIKLTLTNAVLKDTSYECISYDRSGSADSVTVSVDGVEQEIPRALESALRTFRRRDRPRTLWADLLVGRTVEERSSQASGMRQVLENADRALCWLGPEKPLTKKAFDTIHDMANRWTQAYLHVDAAPDVALTQIPMRQLDGIKRRLNDCPYNDLNSFDFALWNYIYAVFGSSYWTSVQCISEIVLAKQAIVVCGRSNIRWHNYVAAFRALPFFQAKFFKVPLLPTVMKGWYLIGAIEVAERRRRLNETLELVPMIQTAQTCDVKDPRDLVFSMIPLATHSLRLRYHNAGPQPLPIIDYSKSVQQVFTEAARYVVLERQDLRLWYNQRPPCEKRIKDLPSWVPDFSTLDEGKHPNMESGLRKWWDTVQPRRNIRVSDDNGLTVQAYPLDRVAHVSPIFDVGNATRLCFEEFKKLPAPISETIEERDTRFWRTLVLNIDRFRDSLGDLPEPPAEMGTNFRSLIAQESVMKLLDCTPRQLNNPEMQMRMMNEPQVAALLPECGKSEPFSALLRRHAIGRRFFRTEGGRFGMTAVEDATCVDPSLREETRPSDGPHSALENMGKLLTDPLSRMMMECFQDYIEEKDPGAARAWERAMRGELPGQPDIQSSDCKEGVTKGDIVVACIEGFYPYILRPLAGREDTEGSATTPQLAASDSTYEFIGDCYLHGAMEGEDFQVKGVSGKTHFRTDKSRIVDITIV